MHKTDHIFYKAQILAKSFKTKCEISFKLFKNNNCFSNDENQQSVISLNFQKWTMLNNNGLFEWLSFHKNLALRSIIIIIIINTVFIRRQYVVYVGKSLD